MWDKIEKIISMYEEDRVRFDELEKAIWILAPWSHEPIIERNDPIIIAEIFLDEEIIDWIWYYLWDIDDKQDRPVILPDWTKINMRAWDLNSLKKVLKNLWLI